MYDGEARHPVMVALARRGRASSRIPIDPFEALISAFEQDQVVTDYDTYEQLLDYCTRSANPVGHLVLYLGRVASTPRTPGSPTRPAPRCNWRTSGRTWPATWTSAGSTCRARTASGSATPTPTSTPAGSPRPSPPCCASRSSGPATCFRDGWPLVERMPGTLAVDVDLFTRGGLAILDRIEAQGFDVCSRRPTVGKVAKLGLLGRAVLPAGPFGGRRRRRADGRRRPRRPPVREEAIAHERRPPRRATASAAPSPGARRRTSITASCCCRRRVGGRCAPSMPSCGTPTTWPTSRATPTAKRRALAAGERTLDRALDGDPSGWPGLPALADTVRRHGIPPPATCTRSSTASRWTWSPARSPTFDDLYGYCYRVASAVGLCCIHIWGYRSEGGRAERLAEACGVALQLTNILRDVREDAQTGRIYLPARGPRPLRRRPRADLARPPGRATGSGDLFAFEGRRAYDYYERGRARCPPGRPGRPAGAGGDRRHLPGPARRDRPARLRRPGRPGRAARLAEGR